MPRLNNLKTFGNRVKNEIGPVNKRLVAFGIARWFTLLFLIIALAQSYGNWSAFGIYLTISLVITVIQLLVLRNNSLTEQVEVTRPKITQDRADDEKSVTLTGQLPYPTSLTR